MWSENFSADKPASFSSFILGLFAFPGVMLGVDLAYCVQWKPCVWCIGGRGGLHQQLFTQTNRLPLITDWRRPAVDTFSHVGVDLDWAKCEVWVKQQLE